MTETVVATPMVAGFVVMMTTALLIVRATAASTMEELLEALELLIRGGVSLLYVADKVERLAGERVIEVHPHFIIRDVEHQSIDSLTISGAHRDVAPHLYKAAIEVSLRILEDGLVEIHQELLLEGTIGSLRLECEVKGIPIIEAA